MEVAYGHGLAQTQMVDVDDQALGNLVVESLHLQLTHGERELTTGLHTLGVTLDLDGNFHHYGLVGIYLEEIDVEQSVLDGLELQVLDHGLNLLAVQVDVNLEDVGSVDELAHILGVHYDVSCDQTALCVDLNQLLALFQSAGVGQLYQSATVDHCGNLALGTESLHRLLAQLCTRLSVQCILFHFLVVVLLKTGLCGAFPITRDFCGAKLLILPDICKLFFLSLFSRR